MAKITLISGGARSGKSTHALALARDYKRKFFVATGEALDAEMAERIEYHRKTRPADFHTQVRMAQGFRPERLGDQIRKSAQVLTGGELRHDAAELSMGGNLAAQQVDLDPTGGVQDCHRGLVTRGFDAERPQQPWSDPLTHRR